MLARLCLLWVAVLVVSCGPGPVVRAPDQPTPNAKPAQAVDLRSAGFSLTPQTSHTYGASSAALSADGKLLVSGGRDGSLRVWDTESGLVSRALESHKFQVTMVVMLPDGKRVLSSDEDGLVRLHDLATGQVLRTFKHRDAVAKLSTLGNERFASVTRGGGVYVWSFESDQVERTLFPTELGLGEPERADPSVANLPPSFRPRDVAGSADGTKLAVLSAHWSSRDKIVERVYILGVRDKAAVKSLDLQERSPEDWESPVVSSLRVGLAWTGPDRLMTLEQGGAVTTWDVTVDVPRRLSVARVEGGADLLSEDGLRVARRAGDRVEVIDVAAGKTVTTRIDATALDVGVLALRGTRVVVSEGGYTHPRLALFDAARSSVVRLDAMVEGVSAAAFTPDGTRALLATQRRVIVWDLETGAPRTLFDLAPGSRVRAFSPDGTLVAIDSSASIELRPITGGLSRSYPGVSGEVVFSQDGKRMLVGSASTLGEGTQIGAIMWDVEAERPVKRFTTKQDTVHVAMTPDAKTAVLGYNDTVEVWERGRPQPRTRMEADFVSAVGIASAGEQLVVGGAEEGGSWLMAPDASGGHQDNVDTKDALSGPSCVTMSPGEPRALVGDLGGHLLELDLAARRPRRTIRAHTGPTKAVAFSADGRLVLSGGADGARLSVGVDGPSIRLHFAGDEWLLQSDEGYFDASRRGADLVALAKGTRGYHVDQAGPLLNRPDLVLSRVGLGRPEVAEHFRARYEHRLKRLGLDASQLSAALASGPEAKITNVERIGKRAKLALELSARGAPLLRYEVFVNGVPLFGAMGKPAAGMKQTLTEEIELSAGRNVVEVAVSDRSGIGSLRDGRVIENEGASRGDLYFLGFGVSKYRDQRLNLEYAHKDVLDLAAAFELMKEGKTAFDAVHVHSFTNEQVTVEQLRKAKALLASATVNDTVVVAVAGHGVHARDAAATYFFVTHETDVRRVAQTAAPFDVVEALLDGIRPRRKLLLLDTCESGDDDGAPGAGLHARNARSLLLVDDRPTRGAPPVAPPFSIDRERLIEGDLSRRTGAIVFSSSRSSERSYESDRNGAFTKEVLLALTTSIADANHDGSVTTEELRRYVAVAVPKRTRDRQHPTVDRDNLGAVFGFPLPPTR